MIFYHFLDTTIIPM